MPRAFLLALAAVNAVLAAAGAVYASRQNIPAATAAPIVAAFLLQISFYMVTGFPEVRRKLEERLSPAVLTALSVLAAVAPYLVYSLPTGVFELTALAKLTAVAAAPSLVFLLWPTRSRALTWQDAAAGGAVTAAVLSRIFTDIYRSPVPGLRLEAMGRIMIIAVGATAFLSLRRLEGSGFQFRMSRADLSVGLRQFAWFLPLGLAVGWASGLIRFAAPKPPGEIWMYPFLVTGMFLGMYAVVALSEELFFRGVLQHLGAATLGSALAAQLLASILFGLSHLPFRDFPNWRFALLSAIAGWFYGQAFRRGGSVVASSITHSLVNTVWRLFLV